MRIIRRGPFFEDPVLDRQQVDIESFAAHVMDQRVQTRDASDILRRLSLGVVEVDGNRDRSVGNFRSETHLSRLIRLDENNRADFFV